MRLRGRWPSSSSDSSCVCPRLHPRPVARPCTRRHTALPDICIRVGELGQHRLFRVGQVDALAQRQRPNPTAVLDSLHPLSRPALSALLPAPRQRLSRTTAVCRSHPACVVAVTAVQTVVVQRFWPSRPHFAAPRLLHLGRCIASHPLPSHPIHPIARTPPPGQGHAVSPSPSAPRSRPAPGCVAPLSCQGRH